MTFIEWWRQLNLALARYDEPQALYGEARDWYDWRPIKFIDDRLINRVINGRKPL